MRSGSVKMLNWRLAGRLLLGTAAAGFGLCFGSLQMPGAAAHATDVAVDLGTDGTGDSGNTGDAGQTTGEPTEREVEVYLSESYDADYNLYELSFNNRYFIFSNVKNGGMTSDPVVIEIPANLTYTMEKDGQAIAYTSGTAVDAVGVYVMTIRLDETDGTNITHYTAVIRFRILEADARVTDADSQGGISFDNGNGNYGISDEELEEIGRRYDDLTPEEQAALEAAFGGSEVTADDLLNPDGTINQERLDEIMAEKLGDVGEIDDIYVEQGINEATGIASVYDPTTGYYKHTLRSGHTFYTDVQNGTVTHLAVTLTGGEGLEFTVYKDGEIYEAEDYRRFSEAGSYMLIPTSSDVVYLDAYQTEKPVFSFRIMDYAINDLSLVHAPEGYRFGDVYRDDLPCTTMVKLDAHTMMLREDGDYVIEMTDGEVTLELSYTLDRVRPRFYVQVQRNKADILYLSKDVKESLIYKNEKFFSSDSIVYTLKETGTYWFYVYDEAGNLSSQAFDVKYGFNRGAAIAIALLIGCIVGLFAYLRYLNTHVRVR